MYEKNQPDQEDLMWRTHMKTLKTKMKVIEISEKLPGIIDEWYKDQGLETPNWQNKKPYFDEDGNIIRPE